MDAFPVPLWIVLLVVAAMLLGWLVALRWRQSKEEAWERGWVSGFKAGKTPRQDLLTLSEMKRRRRRT